MQVCPIFEFPSLIFEEKWKRVQIYSSIIPVKQIKLCKIGIFDSPSKIQITRIPSEKEGQIPFKTSDHNPKPDSETNKALQHHHKIFVAMPKK